MKEAINQLKSLLDELYDEELRDDFDTQIGIIEDHVNDIKSLLD